MTGPTETSPVLLEVIKPDGFTRTCKPDEIAAFLRAWAVVTTGDMFACRDASGASRAAGEEFAAGAPSQSRRRSFHDPGELDLAADIKLRQGEAYAVRLAAVTGAMLRRLGFTEIGVPYQGFLNRVAIEILYHDSPAFDANRELLVPYLLKGPVFVREWRGGRHSEIDALKMIVRRTFATGDLTNLIHMESTIESKCRAFRLTLVTEI